GLYRLDADSKPQPAGAAEEAEVSEDGFRTILYAFLQYQVMTYDYVVLFLMLTPYNRCYCT
ncbi:hypothetical protein, partial [Enterococcus gallinarum]